MISVRRFTEVWVQTQGISDTGLIMVGRGFAYIGYGLLGTGHSFCIYRNGFARDRAQICVYLRACPGSDANFAYADAGRLGSRSISRCKVMSVYYIDDIFCLFVAPKTKFF